MSRIAYNSRPSKLLALKICTVFAHVHNNISAKYGPLNIHGSRDSWWDFFNVADFPIEKLARWKIQSSCVETKGWGNILTMFWVSTEVGLSCDMIFFSCTGFWCMHACSKHSRAVISSGKFRSTNNSILLRLNGDLGYYSDNTLSNCSV